MQALPSRPPFGSCAWRACGPCWRLGPGRSSSAGAPPLPPLLLLQICIKAHLATLGDARAGQLPPGPALQRLEALSRQALEGGTRTGSPLVRERALLYLHMLQSDPAGAAGVVLAVWPAPGADSASSAQAHEGEGLQGCAARWRPWRRRGFSCCCCCCCCCCHLGIARAAGLLACWPAGLLACWPAGLLACSSGYGSF
jgi:hypothetical protein